MLNTNYIKIFQYKYLLYTNYMVKNIQIIDVGSENNEAPKEVEEIKEEPIINEESKEVETNNIINEENNKVEEEHEPKQ